MTPFKTCSLRQTKPHLPPHHERRSSSNKVSHRDFGTPRTIADWFAWCSENAMFAISGHYQARILRYEVISGDGETKVRYDHHEFDPLGPVCQQTRLFRAVNNDWWAFPAATWQPIPLEKRHWYSQRFRREMHQRWELIQRSAAPQSQIAEDR